MGVHEDVCIGTSRLEGATFRPEPSCVSLLESVDENGHQLEQQENTEFLVQPQCVLMLLQQLLQD